VGEGNIKAKGRAEEPLANVHKEGAEIWKPQNFGIFSTFTASTTELMEHGVR
jgi:hypothetical protein